MCEDILESLAINYYVTCSPNLPRGVPGLTLWQQRLDSQGRSLTKGQRHNIPFKLKIFHLIFLFMDQRQQRRDDIASLQQFLDETFQLVPQQHPEKTATLVDILTRAQNWGRRVGGPSKNMIFQLRTVVSGNFNTTINNSKIDIIQELLTILTDVPPQANPDAPQDNPQRPEVVAGWERFFEPEPARQDKEPTALLKLRRKLMNHLSENEILGNLLDEQDKVKTAQSTNDPVTLNYARKFLQEMTGNARPLPRDVPDATVWFLYTAAIRDEIQVRSRKAIPAVKPTIDLRGDAIDYEEGSMSSSGSTTTSDSDLDSYAPNKSFALKTYGKKKSKKKKKRKRKRRKRAHKRKRKRRRSSSSSSSSSSDDDQQPNGRRVSSSAYDSTHYERLQEFREGFKSFTQDGEPDEWPQDEALQFIAKKFGRPGTKFADKRKGVKRIFKTQEQIRNAKSKTKMIYRMADEVAALRIERHEQLARSARRIEGASKAKASRLRQQARKYKCASVREEQTLVARIGVYCDLVLMGKRSWDTYHSELKLGGQREAVVESTGGMVSKAVASKAWKAASAGAVKATPGKPKTKLLPCYWCTSRDHLGKNCPDLKQGKPCHPSSRAAKWPKADRDRALARKKKVRIKIEKQ